MTTIVESETSLQAEIRARLGQPPPDEQADTCARTLIGIVGAPGSGKSTLAASLALSMDPAAMVVPMDGYHLDDSVLGPAGLLPVKGAPHTFDAAGLLALLRRIRQGGETVYAPVFDRSLELSRNAATAIAADTRLVLVEGNYLLLDRPDWSAMRALFDVTIMIDVVEAELERRLLARWRTMGCSDTEGYRRVHDNDLPNGRTIREHSLPADVIYRQLS